MFNSFLTFLASLFGQRQPTVLRDLAYGSNPSQKLDVYRPARPNGAIIFMVHGGAWRTGDKASANVVDNKVAYWGPKGYTIVSVNYRLDSNPYQMALDVAHALRFCQRRAGDWGCDPGRIVLMGHSAGGHLVTLLTADDTIALGLIVKPWRGTVVLDSAAYDVPAIMQGPHPALYDDAFGTDPAYWALCSPQQQLRAKTAPMFLVYSLQRGEGDRNHTLAFATKSYGLGTKVSVYPVDLSHGEVNSTLGLPSDYTNAVDAFIKKVA